MLVMISQQQRTLLCSGHALSALCCKVDLAGTTAQTAKGYAGGMLYLAYG